MSDPFANETDKTVVFKPQKETDVKTAGSHQSNFFITESISADLLKSGINPLEQAASRLLSILVTIKTASSHPAPTQLRNQISHEIEEFRSKAKTLVDDPKQLTMASYVLCSALDEAAFNTPWGHNSDWPQNSLLSTFHGDVSGGERFFELLKRLGASPSENGDLLELMYILLQLGYEGTYKITDDGKDTLVKVRKWLFNILRSNGYVEPATLSINWEGSGVVDNNRTGLSSLWLALAGAAAICALALFTFQIKLGQNTKDTIASFYNVQAGPLTAITPPPPPAPDPVARPTMTELLQKEVSDGSLAVIESPGSALIRMFGDALFRSGKADLSPSAVPLIDQIAIRLNTYDGNILVTGHTDNIPIRKPEFASNLDLSEARAQSVTDVLLRNISNPNRLVIEGAGDLQPLNDNSTSELRSENRRVELTVFY